MCSKRCKHAFKDRIPTCGMDRRYCDHPPQKAAACLLKRTEDLIDCGKCQPANPTNDHLCLCMPESQLGSQQTSQHEAATAEPLSPEQQLSAEFEPAQMLERSSNEGTAVKKSGHDSINKQGSNIVRSSYEKLPPTQIRHMDEWEAMAVMLATNGRVWGVEDKNFARQYKAALSAVNTKFEEEAASMTGHSAY